MTDLDATIRVHTDGVVFNKEMKLNFPRLVPEDKTTGLIKWDGVNNYQLI